MNILWTTAWILFNVCCVHTEKKHHRVCPKYCTCAVAKKIMHCEGKRNRLQYIPKPPGKFTQVALLNFDLGYVNASMTHNLTFCNLTYLTLKENNISGISHDAFDKLIFLKSLIWQQQQLPFQDLPKLFQHSGKKLEKLTLKSKGIMKKNLDAKMFEGLQNMVHLSLNLQNMKVFNTSPLSFLGKLDIIDLSGNLLVSVIIDKPLLNVTIVKLAGNNLAEVPSVCSAGNVPMIPRLKNLDLSNNAIRNLNLITLECLHDFQKLSLSRNRIEHLRNNAFAKLPALSTLIVSNLWALQKVEELAFNSSSLTKLVFLENPALSRKNCNLVTLFKHTPNLSMLDISNTKLQFHVDKLRAMLLNLKNIRKLTLQHVGIQLLPSDTFHKLTKLTNITLTGNYITHWNASVFGNVTSILSLALDGNNIKVVTEEFFPLKFRLSVKEINLADNPFTCTCDLLWFKTWLDDVRRNKSIVFTQYPYRYECRSPNVHRLNLDDFHPTVESCTISQIYFVIMVFVFGGIIVFIIGGLVTYRYRWYILYWISLMRRRRQRETPADIQYDSFVSYSNPDWDWVSEELLDFLEGELQLRLCEHSRDFKAGMYIIDNVIEAIDTSRKTILVISNEFMKSDWCQFELHMALNSFFKQEVELVVILLEQIKACHVTSSLRALMISTNYIEWSSDAEAKRLFRDRLQNAFRE